jgi:HCNGP-like protein
VKLKAEPKVETGPINGPILGPSQPSEIATPSTAQLEQGQSSPYSTSRALIQDLTLPPVPNLDIPPSPPGSPNPVASGKTTQFLSLKKQGVHFNDKLAASSSLKNPSLFVKLREHTGIDNESQYSTTLPHDIWDHTSLPAWAYKEELYKTQQSIRAKIDEARQSNKNRPAVEFVPASGRHD